MANEELPEWARITSDLVDDGGEQGGEVAPSAPAAAPSQPAAPVPVSPVPVPPVPAETADAAPVPLPPVTPARPSQRTQPDVSAAVPMPVPAAEEPASERGVERRRPPRDEEVERHFDDTPFEDPAEPAPLPEEPVVSVVPDAPPLQKKSFSGRKPRVEARPPTINKSDGRKKMLILRLLVWVVLGIIALAGLRAILAPPRVDVAAISAAVAEEYGLSAFPVDRGLAFATTFTREYLTLKPGESVARTERLTPLVTPNLRDATWLRSDDKTTQVVTQGPYLMREPRVADEQHATYIMAAAVIDPLKAEEARKAGKILNPSWVYLSVPMFWAANGGLAVGGPPGFVPGPVMADESGAFVYQTDEEAARSLAVDLEGFFRAWGASSADDLARYLPTDATAAAKAGLGGTVQYRDLSSVVVELVEGAAPRFAQATVVWDYQGSELRQGYRLEVFQDAEGRWYVQDITGGDYQ